MVFWRHFYEKEWHCQSSLTKCFNNNDNKKVLFQRIFKVFQTCVFQTGAHKYTYFKVYVCLSENGSLTVYQTHIALFVTVKLFIACQPHCFTWTSPFRLHFQCIYDSRFARRVSRFLYARAYVQIHFYCRDNVIYCA